MARTRLVDERGLSIVESWFVALATRFRTLKEIHDEIARHSPSVDTSISTMMSYIGAALDFEDIREEDINETGCGSRLDELGKVAIKKKHLGTLSSLNAFIGFARNMRRITKGYYKQQAAWQNQQSLERSTHLVLLWKKLMKG